MSSSRIRARNEAKLKRLSDRKSRMYARAVRDAQWAFMERVAREGVVWTCPWDKYHRHKNDGVYVYGLLGSNDFLHWINSHRDWWKRGPWSEKRCARSLRLTDSGKAALANRELYDMEPIYGGMVEPGYVVTPWPKKAREYFVEAKP